MNAAIGISNSTSLNYAIDLARNSKLKRSLFHLGTAIENGHLPSARSVLTAMIKANPEYRAPASGDGSPPPDQTDLDFKALTDAISNNNMEEARSAWTRVKADLAKSGITSLSDGVAATAKLLAESKASVSLQILNATFGRSSTGALSVMSLFGARNESNSDSGKETGFGGSLLKAWLAYKTGGHPLRPAAPDGTGNDLDTAA